MLKTLTLLASLLSVAAIAQDRFANVEIKTTPLGGSAYMLVGSGGNIGVSAGDDGLLIVDDQFEPLAEKIAAALKEINQSPVRYVVNTHYHGDHTGGNAWFKENQDATIFAHNNVRVRMTLGADAKPSSFPVVTYEQGLKFHFNGDTIHLKHLNKGHTDGDSVVFFEEANVLHAGDLYFNGFFPFIDIASGGSVPGFIDSIEQLVNLINENTKVIPGHGELSNKSELKDYLNMLYATRDAVASMKFRQGLTLEQAIEKGLDDKWAPWGNFFIKEDRWITTLYLGL